MDLNKLPRHTLETVNEHIQHVVQKIDPNLKDFVLFYEGDKFVDIDFYFKDDKETREDGFTGQGIQSFIFGSPTWERLAIITEVLIASLGLKCDESDLSWPDNMNQVKPDWDK